MLLFSLQLNNSATNSYYFNSSFFNAELNYALSINNNLKWISGSGYYINDGWNKQIGVKQQLSLSVRHINLDLDINYKKAVQIIKTEWADQFYTSASFHYLFNYEQFSLYSFSNRKISIILLILHSIINHSALGMIRFEADSFVVSNVYHQPVRS